MLHILFRPLLLNVIVILIVIGVADCVCTICSVTFYAQPTLSHVMRSAIGNFGSTARDLLAYASSLIA